MVSERRGRFRGRGGVRRRAVVAAEKAAIQDGQALPRIAFVGLHGGVFEALQSFAGEAGLQLDYLTDEQIHDEAVDLARYRIIFLQQVRGEDGERFGRLVLSARNRLADLRVIAISAYSAQALPALTKRRLVESDPKLSAYYGSLKDNLRRMLIYINVTYLHGPGKVLPPLAAEHRRTIYHPDGPAPGLFAGVEDFLRWSHQRGWDVARAAGGGDGPLLAPGVSAAQGGRRPGAGAGKARDGGGDFRLG